MQYLWNSAIHFTNELIYLVLMIEIIESFFVNVIMIMVIMTFNMFNTQYILKLTWRTCPSLIT